jgi:hypothetical protein
MSVHGACVKSVILHGQEGGGVTPPLEDAPVNGEQVIKIGFTVLLLSTPQNVVVSTGDDGDGIDLYIPEPAKDSGSAVGTRVGREGAIQTLCLEGESTGL